MWPGRLASFMDKVCRSWIKCVEGLASFMDKVCGHGRVGIVHG